MKEFKGQFISLGENTEKYITFSVPIEKEVTKKSQKPYLTDYNLLVAPDLWQTHDQILIIVLLKEFIKLNANTDMIIKNMKIAKLNINMASAFFDT